MKASALLMSFDWGGMIPIALLITLGICFAL
jgi:hypothetical protein